jgi:hypothetical protein
MGAQKPYAEVTISSADQLSYHTVEMALPLVAANITRRQRIRNFLVEPLRKEGS